jgi:hypothetical protein
MGVTKKAKITFTCEPSLKDGLEVWAQSESRTLSNLIEMLIRQLMRNALVSAIAHPTPAHRTGADRSGTNRSQANCGEGKTGEGQKLI